MERGDHHAVTPADVFSATAAAAQHARHTVAEILSRPRQCGDAAFDEALWWAVIREYTAGPAMT